MSNPNCILLMFVEHHFVCFSFGVYSLYKAHCLAYWLTIEVEEQRLRLSHAALVSILSISLNGLCSFFTESSGVISGVLFALSVVELI